MYLQELTLLNFRNLGPLKLKFKDGPVTFFGDNAQGKTNLLEAIYLLSTTKSFRTHIDHQLISWGEEQAKITGKTELLEVELIIKPGSKKLLVNKQNKKAVDLIGSLVAVIFTPTDIEIIAGAPDNRRRYLDHLGANLAEEYLRALVNLHKIVRSRNQTLFLLREGRKSDLWVWDEQLTKVSVQVWSLREKLLESVNAEISSLGKKLLSGQLRIEYQPQVKATKGDLAKAYREVLEKTRAEEIRKSQTLTGPHRDDFRVILDKEEKGKIVSKDLGIYGSRGEQRAATLALKLAELSIISREKQEQPLLLLDEVLSELDEDHKKLLLSLIKKEQTFITTTNLESLEKIFGARLQRFKVVQGEVELLS